MNLPLVLQQELFGPWLTMKDIGKMDSAICTRSARPMFLKLLINEDINHTTITNGNIASWMSWVVKREVNITTFYLSKVVTPALYMSFFAHIGKRLAILTISYEDDSESSFIQMLSCVSSYCTNIKEISVIYCSSLHGLENILWNSQKTISKLILHGCDLNRFPIVDWKLPSLLLLSINNCENTNDTALPQMLRTAPNLETLSCSNLSYWSCTSQVVFVSQLCVIDLVSCNITDAAFSSLVHSCPLLEVVQLSDCSLLTDVSVLELVQHAKHLKAISISNNEHFSDTSLEAIAVHCGERLRQLSLYDCNYVTDAGLKHISQRCHCLTHLRLGSYLPISASAVQALLQSNPLLWEVSLDPDLLVSSASSTAVLGWCLGVIILLLVSCHFGYYTWNTGHTFILSMAELLS